MNNQDNDTVVQDTLSRCENDLSVASAALVDADAALAKAITAYDAALGQGRDAAVAARRVQGDAEVDRDVARRTVELATARLDEAKASATAAEVERLAAVARGKCREFEAAATRDLRDMAARARRLARLYAEAELARAEAIAGGVGDTHLPDVEGFRSIPGLPQEVVKTERVVRWIHPRTHEPIDDAERMSRIRGGGDFVHLMGDGHMMQLSHQATFDRTVMKVAQRSVRCESFLASLVVPGLRAGDVAGWSLPNVMTPAGILDHLATLEGAPVQERSDRREERVELRLVPASELAGVEA